MGIVDQIVLVLQESDDLRRSPWRGDTNPLAGHCYIASEALYALLGGPEGPWTPHTVKVQGVTHWFLRGPENEILDVTAAQFECEIPYHESRGRGFLTREPSKRAKELLRRLDRR